MEEEKKIKVYYLIDKDDFYDEEERFEWDLLEDKARGQRSFVFLKYENKYYRFDVYSPERFMQIYQDCVKNEKIGSLEPNVIIVPSVIPKNIKKTILKATNTKNIFHRSKNYTRKQLIEEIANEYNTDPSKFKLKEI